MKSAKCGFENTKSGATLHDYIFAETHTQYSFRGEFSQSLDISVISVFTAWHKLRWWQKFSFILYHFA